MKKQIVFEAVNTILPFKNPKVSYRKPTHKKYTERKPQ
jgi:hypothetical protein